MRLAQTNRTASGPGRLSESSRLLVGFLRETRTDRFSLRAYAAL
jgi:hypothetical protein